MITIPDIFTEILDSEVGFERPCSEEVKRKIAQDLNFLSQLALIGSITPLALNQPGVSSPEPTVHQLCDGSEITNATSPLRTMGIDMRFTPDMRNRYLRGANAGTVLGNELGGAATLNLAHAHGGFTGAFAHAILGEEGNDNTVPANNHAHPISSDLSAMEPLEPAHQQIAYYLKIN